MARRAADPFYLVREEVVNEVRVSHLVSTRLLCLYFRGFPAFSGIV